jgi:hypothetical protein
MLIVAGRSSLNAFSQTAADMRNGPEYLTYNLEEIPGATAAVGQPARLAPPLETDALSSSYLRKLSGASGLHGCWSWHPVRHSASPQQKWQLSPRNFLCWVFLVPNLPWSPVVPEREMGHQRLSLWLCDLQVIPCTLDQARQVSQAQAFPSYSSIRFSKCIHVS